MVQFHNLKNLILMTSDAALAHRLCETVTAVTVTVPVTEVGLRDSQSVTLSGTGKRGFRG